MNTKIKSLYIFGALFGVLILTLILSFFMNYQFIQIQLKNNLYQEIEYTRDIYKFKLLNLPESVEGDDFTYLFEGDRRSDSIQILLYNAYGKNIGGNITRVDEGINGIRTLMLNGLVDTIYEDNTFYSFTSVPMNNEEIYLMLEMSDQKYIEGIRNYYLRTILIFVLVCGAILLIGYKLIELQKHDTE